MSQHTIIYKYGKRTRQLKFKKELKNFPSKPMAAGSLPVAVRGWKNLACLSSLLNFHYAKSKHFIDKLSLLMGVNEEAKN